MVKNALRKYFFLNEKMQCARVDSLKYITLINTYSGNDNIPSKKMKKQCARFSSLEYIALIITDNIGPLTVDIYAFLKVVNYY